MIATNVRRLGLYLILSFAIVSGSIVWWQVIQAQALATRGDNPEVIAARRSLLRGTIFDSEGQVLASSQVVVGSSAVFGPTWVSQSWCEARVAATCRRWRASRPSGYVAASASGTTT